MYCYTPRKNTYVQRYVLFQTQPPFIATFGSKTQRPILFTCTKTQNHMDELTHISQEISFEKLGHRPYKAPLSTE